jgi:ribokinase
MSSRDVAVCAPRVVVVGSSNTDLVISCDTLPNPGETVLGGTFEEHAGGKGANQAVAAARAGASVAFVGARGDDTYGRRAVQGMRQEKIDVRHFKIHPGARSGVALILVGGATRQNLIAVARSANDSIGAPDVEAASPLIRRSGIVVAQLEIPLLAVTKAAEIASGFGIPFVLNPAPARTLPKRLLARTDLLVPNEHEAAFLTGERDPTRAAEALLARGCRRVIVTLGARGALLAGPGGVRHFSAPRVKPVDTVGAGDCFIGWLAAGLGAGLTIEAAIQQALRAASLAVTRHGAQPSFPSRREITREP